MGRRERHSADEIEAVLRRYHGNIWASSCQLGYTRQNLHLRIRKSKRLQAVVEEVREELIDVAEEKLKRKILDGNIAAILFFLKTQGKHRGWVERFERQEVNREEVINEIETLLAQEVKRRTAEHAGGTAGASSNGNGRAHPLLPASPVAKTARVS